MKMEKDKKNITFIRIGAEIFFVLGIITACLQFMEKIKDADILYFIGAIFLFELLCCLLFIKDIKMMRKY